MEFSKFFRLPKHEKRRVSPILDSLKFHSKGPVLLQTGTDHSFLGFASKTKLDSSEGWAYKQAYVILLKLVKNKEVLARNGGGKMRRMSLFDIFCLKENLITALEHDTYSFTWVGKSFTSQLTKITWHFSRVMGVDFESFFTKPSVVSLCVQEIWNKTFNCRIPIIHHIIIESVLTATFLQLELWFRVANLFATGRFLSTSAHYLESWLRNRRYLEVCMH